MIQVTGQGISCGEVQVIERFGRSGAACFLEPDDRLVGPRLQQVRDPYSAVPSTDPGIAGLRRRACSARGITSSIDPAKSLR